MDRLLKILLFASLACFLSCSSTSDSEEDISDLEEVQETEGEDFGDGDDFVVDSEEGGGEEIGAEGVEDAGEFESAEQSSLPADAPAGEASDAMVGSAPASVGGGGSGQYTVKKGETLMLVAFNIYGDYARWREIANMNNISSGSISEGMVLNYTEPATKFVWNPKGLPHLIKSGETLGSISQDKYNTRSKWRLLYDNNRPMIKDPNLIFAGFTLYYIPLRDLASE